MEVNDFIRMICMQW